MLTQQVDPNYNVQAWYYKPIFPDLTVVDSSLDWEDEPIGFMCKKIQKKKSSVALIPNTKATSVDEILETKSLIEFSDQGKISLERINPKKENASKITDDGITTLDNADSNSIGNRFKTNQYKIKRIIIG